MLILKSVNFEQQQIHSHRLRQSHTGQTEWMIGRSTSCDLVLPSPEVSRTHGRIVYRDGVYHFVDVGSTTGSFLNGRSLAVNDPLPLNPGDLLQLGETFLYVEGLISPPCPPSADPEARRSWLQPDTTWAGEDLICRCCRIVDETADVKTFYFVAEPIVLFDYLPGQFVNLEVEINGKPVLRSYSISSSPTRPYHLSLTIKRVASPAGQPDAPPGLVSNWLHDHLRVGDRVKLIGGPLGKFSCLPNLPAKLLLISAGSGITPMMSMTRWAQDALVDCDIVFLHCARTSDDIVFRAELEAIAAQMPNFHLAVTTTQQPSGRSWMGFSGRISAAMLNLIAPDLMERSVFVCGPEGFMGSTRSLLESLNFPMQNYQEESFGGKSVSKAMSRPAVQSSHKETFPTAIGMNRQEASLNGAARNGTAANGTAPTAIALPTVSPAVHFTESGQQVTTDGSTSILEIAEQEGVAIRSACRMGACGACKVRIRQGEVRYETPPAALNSADQQAGYALACVALPIHQVAVEA